MLSNRRGVYGVLVPLLLFFASVFGPGACSCDEVIAIPVPPFAGAAVCTPRHSAGPIAPALDPASKTVVPGAIEGSFAVSKTGEASYTALLDLVPGYGGPSEPHLAVAYDSGGGDGVLGVGFSLAGPPSAITRCPKNLALDGEIREVRYDAEDALCLDGRRLIPVEDGPGLLEFKTLPDSFIKIVGTYPPDAPTKSPNTAISFEAFEPSGRIVTYGGAEGKVRGPGGVTRAFLATKARDGRGKTAEYSYCFADSEGYTAEYALTEIRYGGFEGSNPIAPSRAVRMSLSTKSTDDIRFRFERGMQLQSSLKIDEIQMFGPGDTLVRRYGFSYEQSPTTRRTRLASIEECGADGACKPPTRLAFKTDAPGFKRIDTTIPKPTSDQASPMLVDIDGDGLDDWLLPDTSPTLSTPTQPITEWLVAKNRGPQASPPYFAEPKLAFSQEWDFVSDPTEPADPSLLQPELGTAMDYDQDGRMDVYLHNVYGGDVTDTVLLGQANQTFQPFDTGVTKPFPLHAPPPPPTLMSAGASIHLADVDGDGVADRIQCEAPLGGNPNEPSATEWTLHLWTPAQGASTQAGFEVKGKRIAALDWIPCNDPFLTADINGDGKVELLLVDQKVTFGSAGTEIVHKSRYVAHSRRRDGGWDVQRLELHVPESPNGRVLFADVDGDGLPDAVKSGYSDGRLRTIINRGGTFASPPLDSLDWNGIGRQDEFFDIAMPLDYDGDGRQDILAAFGPATSPNDAGDFPKWFILRATGSLSGLTFTAVDPGIPASVVLSETLTLADRRAPRIAEINGDGAPDVVVLLQGFVTIFENLAPAQDLLISVSDGRSDHDPGEPGFVPSVRVSYGQLTDSWITSGADPSDPEIDSYFYRSRADAANTCEYPRKCAVGRRRVVREYALDDGQGGERRYGLRYRDARFHRLGYGFLGFGERILTDLDTGAATADFFDNQTTIYLDSIKVYPYLGMLKRRWTWTPGLPSQPDPNQVELSFLDITPTFVPTEKQKSYFTIPTARRVRREQGTFSAGQAAKQSIEAYVADVEKSGSATVLQDSTSTISDFDTFGNVKVIDVSTVGVDLTLHVEREFTNDTDRWVLGQLTHQEECSSAAGQSKCRTLDRTPTIYGETDTESIATDDGSPDTKLKVVYGRDIFGNVTSTTADDEYGHHRVSSVVYDPEGLFPVSFTDAAGHITIPEYDVRFGALKRSTDPNQLVSEWMYDSLGRLTLEKRPDGTQTEIKSTRTKDAASANAWRLTTRTTTTGGADDTAEYDSRGRPIRIFSYGPDPLDQAGTPPRIMQALKYDRLSGNVARRSVPTSENTPADKLRFDEYIYDAAGREVKHITPWKAVETTTYKGRKVERVDPLLHTTVVDNDALGRPITVLDAKGGTVFHTYGPFNTLYTVEDASGLRLRTTRDALGRVTKIDDADAGTSIQTYNGFGEHRTTTDALGRLATFEYDSLGRTLWRTDQQGAKVLTTEWTWDTAANGLGKLHTLSSPDADTTYSYDALSRLETTTLAVTGESEVFTGSFAYDSSSRVTSITYPSPNGAPAFVVDNDYDAHGYMLNVRDAATKASYWKLTEVDNAGRFRKEAFGNGATTARTYLTDKQALESIITQSAGASIQNLHYEYDNALNVTSRKDALQPQYTAERFRYDELDRLTCAYFSVSQDPLAPCSLSYDYAPNGNLLSKSDVGALTYLDPKHPHAVTNAGPNVYSYDAVGNQISRPGGAIVAYTPFNLPSTITQGAATFTFGYDGNQRRVRKTTPTAETLYFGDLYERVAQMGPALVEHRYYVHSPERVVAVVTRGPKPSTEYLHVDNLGSVDALTGQNGDLDERRSYDPYGQRRNPIWGQPPPGSFTSKTTKGFTGQEDDDELGLINLNGRLLDPKLGRFLTVDPFIANIHSLQSLNPYSYVNGNPLSLIDPSGFQAEDPGADTPRERVQVGWDGHPDLILTVPKVVPRPHQAAKEAGAAAPATDVGTTGSAPIHAGDPPAAESAEAHGPFSAGDITLGGLRGLAREAVGAAAYLTLNLVFGIEVNAVLFAIRVGVGALDGLRDDSPTASDALTGATSAANPMGGLLESIASTYRNAIDGNYPAAAETGAPLVATLVAGVIAGKVAAAPEAAGAAAALEEGAGVAAAVGDGEVWNATGGVDFAKSSKLYPVRPGEKNIVRIEYTGRRGTDYAAANKAANFPRTPKDYTWHHLHDYDPATNTGTMQLVETRTHEANMPHFGGVRQYKSATGKTGKY